MREIVVFGIVGVGATLTHYCCALVFVEVFYFNILLANFAAYCIAVGVSYIGHSTFTFKAKMSPKGIWKFAIVSIAALLLSQSILAFLSYVHWFDFKVNMLVTVSVVPCFSYLLNKYWVYKG